MHVFCKGKEDHAQLIKIVAVWWRIAAAYAYGATLNDPWTE